MSCSLQQVLYRKRVKQWGHGEKSWKDIKMALKETLKQSEAGKIQVLRWLGLKDSLEESLWMKFFEEEEII